MKTKTEEQYPEHTKLVAVEDETQAQGQFLEWLGQQGYAICEISKFEHWHPITDNTDKLLARMHNIDLVKLEQEKRQILDECRTQLP